MVSLKDIAAECKVSVATVSKALNDHQDIGASTKERIREQARLMGYLPNSAAKTLKTNKSKNIGILFVDEGNSGLTHDYFSHVLDAFKREAESKGYDLTFINCSRERNHHSGMTYLEHTRYRGLDGVIIACIDFESFEAIELLQSDIPVVTIDFVFNNCSAVISDNVAGMQALVKYAADMGHRRIALIYGDDTAVTRNRLSSFYRTLEELRIDIADAYVKQAAYRDTRACEKATKELLDLKDIPTCIFYPDDFSSLGGIRAIKERGLDIPGDISIIGYDGIPISRYIEPPLVTWYQDTEMIGKRAAEELINLIERPRTTLIQAVTIGGKLQEGRSVKKIN